MEAIEKAGYTGKVKIGIDAAASEFYKAGKYDLDFKNPNSSESKWLTAGQLSEVYNEIVKKYPIFLIEDPFDQDDWDAFKNYTAQATVQVNFSLSVHSTMHNKAKDRWELKNISL